MPKEKKSPKMNIVLVGHVDHGKSTVLGRLLADTGSLPQGKLEQVKTVCRNNAKPFEYAFLLDALKDEQSQGITIDSARCFFRGKNREYIIIDAPGHIEFLKNMVSGAARAEAALLVIDASEGVRENSKRHGYLLSMLGIKQIAVCVNKMDLVGYRQSVFREIEKNYRAFLKKIGLEPKIFIPVSAREGDNIVKRSPRLKWAERASVLSVLDSFHPALSDERKPFRMPVQAIYKFTEAGDDRRIVAGRVESGTLSVGDKVIFFPSHKRSSIRSIEEFHAPKRNTVSTGCSAGVTLSEQIYVRRGEVMCKLAEPAPLVSSLVQAELFWLGRTPMIFGKEYKLKIGTDRVPAVLKKINRILDASDLRKLKKNKIGRHDVAECVLECFAPIVFDLESTGETMGRFVVVDEYDIAGGGIITAFVKDEQAELRTQVFLRDQRWESGIVEPKEREVIYGNYPQLVLLTGDTRYDKKSPAKALEKMLFRMGKKTYFLGIGNLLRGLDSDLERDRASRTEHVRRLGEVSHILMDAGLIVVATASDLKDEELKMLQEVTNRDSMLVVNLGKNEFREGAVDLLLNPKDGIQRNVKKILSALESRNVLSPPKIL